MLYPTNSQLNKVKKWKINSKEDLIQILDYVEKLHYYSKWGFHVSGKNIIKIEFHTGGWSGNESLIEALQDNFIFWTAGWEKSTKGGHYWFRFDVRNWK